MPNGAELFVRSSIQLGLDTIFTLVGDHLNEVLAAAARAGMRIVDLRHESGVAHAADAWARIHRRPALSLVTGGPGHTNSLTGIATAQLAGSPLIAVSGSRATTLANRQAFQDIDQVAMARPVVKWAAEPPNAAQIPFYLERAYRIADAGRKGAVHLTIPVDLFTQEGGDPAPAVLRAAVEAAPCAACRGSNRTAPPGRAAGGCRGVGRLVVARRRRAAAFHRAHVVTAVHDHDGARRSSGRSSARHGICRPRAESCCPGGVPGGRPGSGDRKRIDYRLAFGGKRLFGAEAKFVQIDLHEEELGLNRPLNVAIHADARATLEALTKGAGSERWAPKPWLDRVRALRCEWETRLGRFDADSPMHPAAFFHELRQALPRDVLYSWDGGDFVHWGRAILPARRPGGWLRLGPLGTIGAALPNALALQLAHPGQPVAAITGDGALGFYLAEMDSAVRHKLPIVVIVGNDGGWGLERELQSFATGGAPTVACELRASRYDVVMQAFGGGGETIETVEQARPAIERAFAAGGPYCLNVRIRGVRSPFTDWQIAGKARS